MDPPRHWEGNVTDSSPRPDVSFLITHFNGARQVERTLPRLVEVMGREWFERRTELVFADGGSTDDSVEVVRRWAAPFSNVRIVQGRANIGRGRQIALEHSRGRYVALLDSDHWVREEYAPFLRAYIEWADLHRRSIIAYENADGERANWSCSFHPRENVEAAGGWRDIPGAEDLDLFSRMVLHDDLSFLPVCLVDDVEHAQGRGFSVGSTTDYRTIRDRQRHPGFRFYVRWIRATRARYVALAYTLREKVAYDWRSQPRWSNRLMDLAGSTLARVDYYLHPERAVRIRPECHNGIELHRYFLTHMVRPSDFGLSDDLMELRGGWPLRDLIESGALPAPSQAIVDEVVGRHRWIFTPR